MQQHLRAGVHVSVQTNLLRYRVQPYPGEFQATASQSMAVGVVLQFPIDEDWSLMAEVTRWKQSWHTQRAGELRFALGRRLYEAYDFPLLVVYRPPVPVIPLYAALGPQVMLAGSTEDAYELRYFSFSEREGWKENRQSFDQTAMRLAAVAEVGLDLPFSSVLSFQLGMRFMHPFVRGVDETVLAVRDFSYWRIRSALLVQF